MAKYLPPETLAVGNGAETVFGFTFPYLLASDLAVTVGGVAVPVYLVGTAQVYITPAPANGAQVRIYRNTPAQFPMYQFSTGVPMLPKYIDQNNRQLLYALQEGLLLFDTVEANANAAVARAIRVGPSEPPIPPLPSVADRAGRVLGFDSAGRPIATLPATGSGTELAIQLADPAQGARLVATQAPNGRRRTLGERMGDELHLDDFVTYADGRDETTMVQLAFDTALATGRRLIGRPGMKLGLSATLRIDINTRYDGYGAQYIPLANMTSGTMIQVQGRSNRARELNGLNAACVKGSRGTLIGVTVGTPTGEIACWDPSGWCIEGFHDNLVFSGNNVYIIGFSKSLFLGATRRNISWECLTNSGESITFDSGSVSDAKNATNTAIGVYVAPGAASPDMRFTRMSMSYNDYNGDIATGKIELFGVHEENRNVNPFWRVRNTVGAEKTVFGKYGGSIASGPLSAGTEPLEGRECLVLYDGSASVIIRDAKLGTFREGTSGPNRVDDYVTQVVQWSGIGSDPYRIRVTGEVDGNRASAVPIDIGVVLNSAYLTGPNAFDGFLKNTIAGVTFTEGTDGHGRDTRNRAIESSTAATGSYNLQVPMRPGQTVLGKVSVKTVGATAATQVGARMLYFTNTGVQIASRDFARQITTPNNLPYVVQYTRDIAPPGTAYVIMQMQARGITGAARFSNERMWVLE